MCSGSAHEMCGRAGGGASATARDCRAGDDRFVEPKDRERARLRFDATDRRTRATGANAGAVGRRETAAQVIRPRMPEKVNRLAALVKVLERYTGDSRPVEDSLRKQRDA